MLTKEELQEIVRIVFFNKEVGEERLTDFTEALVSSAVKLVDCIGNHHSRCRIYLLAMKGAQSSDTRQMYLELARATALMVTGPEDDRFSMHHRIVLAGPLRVHQVTLWTRSVFSILRQREKYWDCEIMIGTDFVTYSATSRVFFMLRYPHGFSIF